MASIIKNERNMLLERAKALCQVFAMRKSVEEILTNFSDEVVCFEHGLQKLAPFLGRKFVGLNGAKEYFELIAKLLDFSDMEFSDYIVDDEERQVSVRGSATFVWKSTAFEWQEIFTYRLKFDQYGKICSYEVWADSGAAYLASRGRRIILATYEFTYSPFSGNGILARSIVKALLQLGCHVTVWCCQPYESQQHDNHLEVPEICEESRDRLALVPLQLEAKHGWRKLDDESAWEYFVWENLCTPAQQLLRKSLSDADAVCAIDWTGANAVRSLLHSKPVVYLNFRVYSSGVADASKHQWYDDMENKALQGASSVVVLSRRDQVSLESISCKAPVQESHILLPPLRGDMERLALKDSIELQQFLPQEFADMLCVKPRFLVTCVARLSHEKKVMRFVRFLEKAKDILDELGLVPLLAGATSEEEYASSVKRELRKAAPNSIIISHFLEPSELVAIFSRTVINFHPSAYDAYGMTIVEAAACGVPSVVAKGDSVGATALIDAECSIQVAMPNDENIIDDVDVGEIAKLLRDPSVLDQRGQLARHRALAWDEGAYGKRLLEIISGVSS
jgi:glycosyltransferase involved in cell wall biosynthesis